MIDAADAIICFAGRCRSCSDTQENPLRSCSILISSLTPQDARLSRQQPLIYKTAPHPKCILAQYQEGP